MTLGEFRKITAKLPDNTEFVDGDGTAVEYSVCTETEYYRVRADGAMIPIRDAIRLTPIYPKHPEGGTI